MSMPRQLLTIMLLVTGVHGQAAQPPLSAFFDNAPFNGAKLSPSGRYVAAFVAQPGRRDGLAVIDLGTMQANMAAQFGETGIGKMQWVNDERLLFSTVDKQTGTRDLRYAPGLYAVNRDGKHFRQLALRQHEAVRETEDRIGPLPWHTYMLDQDSAQDSDHVYVADLGVSSMGAVLSTDLMLLNTRNGGAQPVDHPGTSRSWLLDHNGKPRLMTTINKNIAQLQYLDPATGKWRVLISYDAYAGGDQQFAPLAFGPDGALYVVSYVGRDRRALYRYDLERNQLAPQPLVDLDKFDFDGHLIVSKQRLLGVRVHSDAEGTYWFDPEMKTLQASLDQLLPGTVNLITPPLRPETPWVLVESYSDKQPRRYLVFNTETKRLREIGRMAPQIKAGDMGTRELYFYPARDGLQIPVWLTLPPGERQRNLPMVVLVHGGPWLRGGSWHWDAESQFLASRGYAVLEPEFRGSTGYGKTLFNAGLKQWGLAMQDDLADGARWAIAQGYADAKRICIAGASYGGYATLMGLAKEPELYRCGVEWLGVTDIHLLYDSGWFYSSDISDEWKRYGLPRLIGDPVADAAQLHATSPLRLADRIKRPLLMAYGGADTRVPLNHGLKFRDAVKAHNQQVEWIEYREEGHGWSLPQNRIDFWGRVEKFLDKNIGTP